MAEGFKGFQKGNTLGKLHKGQKMSEETKKKLSLSKKGKHFSPKTEFKKDFIPWNKGNKEFGKKFGYKKGHKNFSPKSLANWRENGGEPWNKGLYIYTGGKKFQKGHIPWNKDIKIPQISGKNHPMYGKKHSQEALAKMSKYWIKKGQSLSPSTQFKKGRKGKRGKENYFWKGGITPINLRIRMSLEYEDWRKMVLERDNYTCQECNQIGGRLEVDHIKSFSLYPELRFDINNGRTLCHDCHKLTDTYGGKSNKKWLTLNR